MGGKAVVRISPFLLGKVGEAALSIVHGSLIVQFAGRRQAYSDGHEWNVTHAILSNSLAVSSPETRAERKQRVDALMCAQQLSHIGWLRQASISCPLSSLDLDTQRVYESHLPESFAAMLDINLDGTGPVVYFYCLANPRAVKSDSAYNAFVAAQHVVLDTSVSFTVTEVSFCDGVAFCVPHVPERKEDEDRSQPNDSSSNTTAFLEVESKSCRSSFGDEPMSV